MPKYTSNAITIIDSLDSINVELYVSSNLPTVQVRNANGQFSPSWVTNPLVLTPTVYAKNKLVSNANIVWERRSGGRGYTTSLIQGESVLNGVLTVNKDILNNDESKIISYKCTVTYGGITKSVEKTFSLNVIGADGKDGSSVSIKSTGYTSETTYTVGQEYTLYSDSALKTQITEAESGDSYLVGGYLFVYAGNTDKKFVCVGDIKGVGITSITGPVTNGLIDTYTMHFSDGTKRTYQITNGVSPRILDLYASKYAVAYNSQGKLKDDSPIVLMVTKQNINSDVTWTVSEGGVLSGTGDIRTLAATSFDYKDSIQVIVTAGGMSDAVTIVKVQDGLTGPQGQSTFVTYHDSIEKPNAPTGNGASNGWHTNMTNDSIWMSLKVSDGIAMGTWGAPVKIKGTDGRGISNTAVTYQVSDSGAEIPTGAWLPTLPAVLAGQYLWTKTVTSFTDGTSVTGYNIGRVGENGSDGKGIKTTVVTYQSGNSGTVAPTGIWSANIPTVAANQYLWTRTIITYTDDTTSTSYSIGRMGYSGVDGYTIALSNESHTFAGSSAAALASNTTCDIIAYKGATRIAATVGTISGVPTGMTAAPINNGTINAGFTVAVTTAMKTENGTLTVPITVDGKTFNKVFSYSIAFQGPSAELVDIIPSALYFKSTTGKDGVFTPDYIYLYPRFQSVTYSNWQYSIDGGTTWVSASGVNGLTIGTYNSVANSLRISKGSTLYTDSITSISFKCNSTNTAIYDIVSIAKIYDVVDLQIGGRNLIQKTDETTEMFDAAKSEYYRTNYDLTPIFDKYGLIEYTLSFDLYSELAGEMRVYLQNGSGAEYFFSKAFQATENWQRYSISFIPSHNLPELTQSYLSFYGGYGSGKTPHIKRVKLETGNKATDWTPAPEDISAAIEQESGIVAMLSNESQFFVANANGVPTATSVILDVVGYKGATQQNTAIGSITGLPSAGMTATISNNDTQNTKITIAVTAALTSSVADYGVLTIPITIAGKTINKKFNWAKSKAGATGTSSVSFEIYSDTGFIFHNEDQIELKTHKFYGATAITISGATTIQWSKMTSDGWANTWKYDSGDTSNVVTNKDTLIVKSSEVNGTQLYKCTLTYNGKTYTDIVTITDKSDVYQSKIVSIGGNVLHGGEIGITAYASLYHGADEEDVLKCPIYSQGTTPIENQAYYVLDGSGYTIKKYVSNAWVIDTTIKQDHMYSWFIVDKYTGEQQSIGSGKIVYITNDVISKSGIVQCKIDNISMCTESFTDANDPIIGSEQPNVTTSGQLWFNTDDGILYAYKEASGSWEPVNSGQNRTYTSAPIIKYDCCFYKKGDLWIVGDNDSIYTDVKPGTLLVAVNGLKDGAENWDSSTWKDRLAVDWDNKLYYDETLNSIIDYQQRLSAYMNFEVDGLKIGANNTEFYTKVTPYDLGFYQGPEKVAYVSNKKMYNTSLEVSNDVQILKHKSDEQPNPQKPYFMLGNFRFIIEENGSMSIARALMISPQPRVKGYNVSGKVITIYFTPWSSNASYGYKSAHDTTAINNIQLLNEDGAALSKTTTTGTGYIRITSSANLPKNIRITLPYHVVYNIGQSNSDYDLTDVGSDAITLAISTDV